jgi:hypothetical protein
MNNISFGGHMANNLKIKVKTSRQFDPKAQTLSKASDVQANKAYVVLLGFDKRQNNSLFDLNQGHNKLLLTMKQSKKQLRNITQVFDQNEAGKQDLWNALAGTTALSEIASQSAVQLLLNGFDSTVVFLTSLPRDVEQKLTYQRV